MDGFAEDHPQSMVYWTDEDLPYYYSLARNFTLANRWFSSAPVPDLPEPALHARGDGLRADLDRYLQPQ